MKNVAFVTIDALTYSSLGAAGHRPSPTPTLDRLASEGMSLDNCFSTGPVTQFAFPSLMSSTLPLDYGGYDRGILDRPATLATAFADAGYVTGGFPSAWWQDRLFGYDRGFDDFYSMCAPSMFLNGLSNVYGGYYDDIAESDGAVDDEFVSFLRRWFDRVPAFCAEKADERDGDAVTTSPSVHGWDFERMQAIIEEQRAAFDADPAGVVPRVTESGGFVDELLSLRRDHASPRLGRRFRLGATSTYVRKNVQNVLGAGISNPSDVSDIIGKIVRKATFSHQSRVPSAAYQFRQAGAWIDDVRDRPWFLWVHLMDVHDRSFVSWERGRDGIEPELDAASEHLRELRRTPDWTGNPYYDLAVRYVDERVSDFLEALSTRGQLEDTIVVVAADHGHHTADRPIRLTGSIEDLHDEHYHVPAIVWNAGERGGRRGLASTIDVPATVLDAAGLSIPDDFDGRSALDPDWTGREHVLMEHTGRGPCDVDRKPIRLVVRGETEKVAVRDDEVRTWDVDLDGRTHVERSPSDLVPSDGRFDALHAVARERVTALQALHGTG